MKQRPAHEAIADDECNMVSPNGLVGRNPESAEFVQMRIRVIALENLLIALLSEASDRQLDLIREMAIFISPRPGFTTHPLTTHAASHMVDLVERAERVRMASI